MMDTSSRVVVDNIGEFAHVVREDVPMHVRIGEALAGVAAWFAQGFVMGVGFSASVSLLLWARVI